MREDRSVITIKVEHVAQPIVAAPSQMWGGKYFETTVAGTGQRTYGEFDSIINSQLMTILRTYEK